MNSRKSFIGLLATALSVAAFATAANAQDQITFATISSIGGTQTFTYNSNTGFGVRAGNQNNGTPYAMAFAGLQTFGTGAVSNENPVEVQLTGLQNNGVLTSSGGTFTQDLTGGTFTVFDREVGSATFGQNLLSGTFTTASLSGNLGSTTGAVSTIFNQVMYTGGVYFTRSGLLNPGGFSINLTSIFTTATNAQDPPGPFGPGSGSGLKLNAAGNRFASFRSSGSGTFSATASPVPEPSEYAMMGMAGFALCGLMIRSRRRKPMSALAA